MGKKTAVLTKSQSDMRKTINGRKDNAYSDGVHQSDEILSLTDFSLKSYLRMYSPFSLFLYTAQRFFCKSFMML